MDDLTTNDIYAYSKEHFALESPIRIEWIDDTSANIVYSTAAVAAKALNQLALHPTKISFSPSLQLQIAKPFLSHPESNLEVRTALLTDQKRPRAYEASRFYMMHPEHDPREQRRHDRSDRNSFDDYKRRRYSHEEHRRRRKLDGHQGFSSTMYDDGTNATMRGTSRKSSRRDSYSTRSSVSSFERRNATGETSVQSRRHMDSYRPGRVGRPHPSPRDRSASPGRQNSEQEGRRTQRRLRRRTPPPPYQTRDPFPTKCENHGKELFPSKSVLDIRSIGNGTDLFPNKTSAANLKKELFPNKTSISNHRRSDAFDAADETAELFASSFGLGIPAKAGVSGSRNDLIGNIAKNHASTYGRLKSLDPESEPSAVEIEEEIGLNIRGASKLQDSGFSIRGSAGNTNFVGTTKELFPGKAVGNAGKELFAERLHGRGSKRNRAEDMFY